MFKKKTIIRRLARHVTYGMHDLLRTNAANIHTNEDWSNIFAILQVYGAGSNTPLLSLQQQQLSKQMSLDVVKSTATAAVNSNRYDFVNLNGFRVTG